jgi:LmbE family N-acetylglucosaminyl deacetylase
LKVLALGAHADDIEIGCGGTLLRLASEREIHVTWVVFCSTPRRQAEARASAADFLAGAASSSVIVHENRDGFLPWAGPSVKESFEALKAQVDPHLILTHYRDDRHQDHRVVSELTWNTWRRHLILEYEIPKYDGDLGSPSFFVPVSPALYERKIELLLQHYPSQVGKHWFTPELFRSLARIRAMECASGDAPAEAFYCRKATL